MEEHIIKQLKKGNEEAYRYLYTHYYALLCHIAQEYVGDKFLAETLASDVFFHLWEIHETLDIQLSLRNYLIKAVRNHCVDFLSLKQEQVEVTFSTLLNNRINMTLEYYHRVISDLLVTSKALLSYNGLTTMAANIGSTQGQGIEFTLNTQNIATQNFSWSTDITLYKYVDRWKERDPNWKPNVYESTDDYICSIFVYKSDGLLQPGEKAPAWQPSLLPGQVKIQNLKDEEGKDNIMDQYDKVLLGSEDLAFTFGFNNTLRYKRSISMFTCMVR